MHTTTSAKWIAALSAGLLTVMAVGSVASAADKMSKADVLSKYERTGKMLNCISLPRIRSTQILDDQTILFKLTDKSVYLNEFPHACPQLKSMDAYTHRSSLNKICSLDSIRVLDTTLVQELAGCSLGKFELLKSKPAKD